MNSFDVGIRKFVENDQLKYWLLISAKPMPPEEDENGFKKLKHPNYITLKGLCLQLPDSIHWKILIICTIYLNIILYVTYFWIRPTSFVESAIVLMHATCLFYWIELIASILKFHKERKTKNWERLTFFIIDCISLIPLSTLYLITVKNRNIATVWKLRTITLLRFYRIPRFFSIISSTERNGEIYSIFACALFLVIFLFGFANIFIYKLGEYSTIQIFEWNKTNEHIVATSVYFVTETTFNVAYGDIKAESYSQMALSALAMFVGTSMMMGVFPGILFNLYISKTIKREYYRCEYESILNVFKSRRLEKKILEKLRDNMLMLWKYTNGYTDAPPVHILPLSLQKEIYFDINYEFLNRSLIFHMRPRSFLRSVALLMKYAYYLPGDIILEPFGAEDTMMCVASGVIEVLSEENDDTPLLSLTRGTILGETSLFISHSAPCFVRASTYVELQVLSKVDFSRLALKYPEIIRLIREDILERIAFTRRRRDEDMDFSGANTGFRDLERRKRTKVFLKTWKDFQKESVKDIKAEDQKAEILELYVLSENIPRVKTLPIDIIRSKPWILRPNNHLTKFWDIFLSLVIIFVAIIYPLWAAYHRKISPNQYMILLTIKIIYFLDLIIECITAIERKDHFTYETSFKGIIRYKLKTFGFYLDILATYHLGIYDNLIWPSHSDYAHLLLSLNSLLKIWRLIYYVDRLQNDMKNNLVFIITVKYIIVFIILIVWSAVLLYIVACPGDFCIPERWFHQYEKTSLQYDKPHRISPISLSLYFATVTLFAVGYGDIVPTSVPDCLAAAFCIIVGTLLIGFCTAETSSALKHMARIKIDYQEDIFGVDRFMIDHDIPKDLQNDVRNFLKLQWEYDKGYGLKKHYKLKKVPSLQRHIWLVELTKAFYALPLFRDQNPEFLKLLAKLSQLRVLPADTDILQAGSYFRVMYVLESGYCQVSGKNIFHSKIVGPVNSFGGVEMILGTPQALTVHSLTHVRVISLNYSSYLRAITKFPGAKAQIEKILDEYKKRNEISELINAFENVQRDRTASSINNKYYRLKSYMNVYKYHKGSKTSYWDPFKAWGKFQILQFFILPYVVSPDSMLVKIMMIVRIISALSLAVISPIQFCFPNRTKDFMIFITTHQAINALCLYMMLYVGYYDEKGILVFHPAKTIPRYLKGSFVLDLITIFPYSLIRWMALKENNTPPSLIIDAPMLILGLHLYKFIQGCQYLEENILRNTDKIKILKYIPLAFLLTNTISGVMILLSCDEQSSTDDTRLLQGNRLAREYQNAVQILCSRGPYKNQTLDDKTAFKLYITTLYWVTATMGCVGFGDIVAYNKHTMIAVVLIVIYGLFFFSYIYANIASNMLNTNILITKHRTNILKMVKFMKRNNVNPELQQRLTLHYAYLWQRTEGETPQFVFNKVYAILRERLVASTYEDTILQSEVFDKWNKVITRLIADNLNEIYFLQGEIIVKYNDILEHIYLIYRGKVTLNTKEGDKITSMGCGGLFGNISNKPFALSSKVIIAEENVDVLRWDCKVFFQFLKDIPGVEDLIKKLMSAKEGYIKPKPKENNETDSDFKINLFHLQTPLTEVSGVESHFYQKRLFLFKTIYIPKDKNLFSFIIIPERGLHKGIVICVIVLAYVSVFLTLYMFAFQDISSGLLIFSYAMDGLFVIKIILEFHISHIDKFGNCAISQKKITKRYISSGKIFYDLSSIVPLEIFSLIKPGVLLLTTLRLNRIVRVQLLFEFYKIKQRNLMKNEIYLQAFWILLMVILMLHAFACVWFVAVCPLGYCQEPTWVTEMNFLEKEKWELYFYSVYHIIVITVASGMAELQIYSVPEIILNVAFMYITRLSVVYLAAFLSAAINSRRLSLVLFQERITELTSIFKRQNVCKYQLVKMWHYVASLWLSEKGKQIPKFISTAPYVMKCEIMYEMYGKHLSQSYIFSKLDVTFLRQLAFHLIRYVYFPGNYIVQQGDIDETIYFIHQGEVSVLTIHPDLMETIHFTLGKNDYFGMKQGFNRRMPHSFSYRAETNVEIVSLTLSHWQHLLKYFPNDEQKIIETFDALPKNKN